MAPMKTHTLLESTAAVTLEPLLPARAAVIWLHGLGADGHDFVPIVAELGAAAAAIRFVFPHAPVRPVTINGGMPMRAWYDILSLTRMDRQDEAGIAASQALVRELIATQNQAGIPASRIVIAGFSQGGAITLHAGLRYPERLAGLMALSTYLPLHERLGAEISPANRDVPILMVHGSFDPVLPQVLGESSCELLRAEGLPVEWHSYPMQHQVCEEEIERIGSWLRERLG
jgi:phospholipase/carboxylesterase